MPKYDTEAIRNVALLGASGSGKTTMTEAMLHEAGAIGRVGRIEDRNTVCDFEDLEKEVVHSLDSALVHLDFGGAHFNVLDTPGTADFLGRALSVVPAVETALVVLDATAGIETVTRRVMKAAEESRRPRMIVINKIDNAAGLDDLLSVVQEAFGSVCRPVNLPADGGTVIDLVVAPDGGVTVYEHIGSDHAVGADLDVRTDDRVGTDRDVVADAGLRANHRRGMDFRRAQGTGPGDILKIDGIHFLPPQTSGITVPLSST